MTAIILFALTYVAFSFGHLPGLRSDRMGAAVIGAALVVAFGVLPFHDAQASIDGATIALLFGMMVLSAALEVSGAFALVGWWVTRRASSPRALLVLVSLASAVLSAFLINDVVCIAFTPLVIHMAESIECDPKPHLLALATSSNVGSVATITGNPQNILIASVSGISYGKFALALAPVAAMSLAINIGVLLFVYRGALAPRHDACPAQPRPRVYKRWVWKGGLVTAGVLVAFIAGVSPPIAALVGAAVMLLTRAVDPKRVYTRVDWSLLALFAGLFVVVAGVERAGLAERMLGVLSPLHPENVLGLTAIAAILSNVVSNVPAVMVLKSMIPQLANPTRAWLVLAMASTLAGNLTLAGSMATVIVVERAKIKVKITWGDFFRVGIASGIASLLVGAAWLWMT
jgi:Na+/H+ antiporter NhaD/arsenite permease-like protein